MVFRFKAEVTPSLLAILLDRKRKHTIASPFVSRDKGYKAPVSAERLRGDFGLSCYASPTSLGDPKHIFNLIAYRVFSHEVEPHVGI